MKVQVVLVSVGGDKTAAKFSRRFGVHASRIVEWKQQVQAQVVDAFGRMSRPPEAQALNNPIRKGLSQPTL